MARHKLPIFTERTIAETRADQIAHERKFSDPLERVSCHVQCSACCHHAIHCTIPEGIVGYQQLARKGFWTPSLRKRLEDHARQTWDLSTTVWHLSNIPCPLLERQRCSIYDARPFTCRVTFATGDPEQCHPHRVNNFSSILPKRDALQGFFDAQGRLLKRHGQPVVAFAVSQAILVGAKIATGEQDIETALGALLRSVGDQA